MLEKGASKKKVGQQWQILFISHIIVKNKHLADEIVLPSLTCGFQGYPNHKNKK